MPISTNTFLSDSTKFLRDLLVGANGPTDPVSSRPATSRFVMTSYPKRNVFYPIITVNCKAGDTVRLGMRSEGFWAQIEFEIRIWAKSVKQRDDLTEQTFDSLRDEQLTASTGSVDNLLYGLGIDSTVNVDEDGIDAVHSTIINGHYMVALS